MLFEILVVIVLLILIVQQFDLLGKFTQWYSRRTSDDSAAQAADSHGQSRNFKGIIFIIIVGAAFALIIAYFQTTREILFNSKAIAIEQLLVNSETFTEVALNSQTEIIRNSFDFGILYWNKFFENTAWFILLPILISAAIVFLQDEMKVTKKQMDNVNLSTSTFTKYSEKKEDSIEVQLTNGNKPNDEI